MPELIGACSNYAVPWAFGGYAVFADSELASKHGLGEDISSLPQFLSKLGGPAKYGKTTRDIYALGISNTVKSVPGAALARLLEPASLSGQYALRCKRRTPLKTPGTAITIQRVSAPCWARRGTYTGWLRPRAATKCARQ